MHNYSQNIFLKAYVREHGTKSYGPEGRVLAKKTKSISRIKQFDHSKMCIDHITGFKLEQNAKTNSSFPSASNENSSSNDINNENNDQPSTSGSDLSLIKCYKGPGHINEQRKFKRRCLGIHTYPLLFDR